MGIELKNHIKKFNIILFLSTKNQNTNPPHVDDSYYKYVYKGG